MFNAAQHTMDSEGEGRVSLLSTSQRLTRVFTGVFSRYVVQRQALVFHHRSSAVDDHVAIFRPRDVHVVSDVTADVTQQSHVVAASEVAYVIGRPNGNEKLACATTNRERQLETVTRTKFSRVFNRLISVVSTAQVRPSKVTRIV